MQELYAFIKPKEISTAFENQLKTDKPSHQFLKQILIRLVIIVLR